MKEIYPIIQKLIETLEKRKELTAMPISSIIYLNVINIIKHTFKNINEDDIIISKSEYIKLLYLYKHHIESNYHNSGKILEIKEIEEINERIEYLKL